MGRVHKVHCPRPTRAPRLRAQRPCRAPAANAPRAVACSLRACRPRALPRARAPACALAAPCRAPSVPPARPASRLHAPPAHSARALRAQPVLSQRPVHCHNTILYCDIVWPPAACCNTIHCIATQLSSSPSSLLQYNPAYISAIQTTVLQHKNPYTSLLTCNTILYCN